MRPSDPISEEGTPDASAAVALALFQMIAEVEKVALAPGSPPDQKLGSRWWVFHTYAECLRAVTQPKERLRRKAKRGLLWKPR